MTESVLEFLQGQNVRCKIVEALMWLNVSGWMFNLPLRCALHTIIHYNTCLHCKEEGSMFNSAAKEKCKQGESREIQLSIRSKTFLWVSFAH